MTRAKTSPAALSSCEAEGEWSEPARGVEFPFSAIAPSSSRPRPSEIFVPTKPRTERGLKSDAYAAIANHLLLHGHHDYDRVRESPEFAHLFGREAGEKGRRKFYRYLKAASEPTSPDKTRPHEAREAATDALRSATERARLAATKNLPAPPSPEYLLRAGAEGTRNINFLAEVHLIWADVSRLREHAMAPDQSAPEGMRIVDAKLFDASIHRRIQVMEAALRVMQEVWDLDFQQRFYAGITQILVEELAPVPEIQERVIQKLTELNNARGMTIHAEVN